jgi:hypothetical protein
VVRTASRAREGEGNARRSAGRRGFTLIELLIVFAVTVFAGLFLALAGATQTSMQLAKRSRTDLLSRGCHEIDEVIYGAIVHDQYPGAHRAASERGVYLDDDTAYVHYSQCAVRRALEHSALGMYMGTSFDPLPERGFMQKLR